MIFCPIDTDPLQRRLDYAKKQQKEFIEYPLRLYKDNPYFVPPLYMDEKALFTDKNIYSFCKINLRIFNITKIFKCKTF